MKARLKMRKDKPTSRIETMFKTFVDFIDADEKRI